MTIPSNEQLIELSFTEAEGATTVLAGQQPHLDRSATRARRTGDGTGASNSSIDYLPG